MRCREECQSRGKDGIIKRIKKMAEKNGYITEEVSAKTGEKVDESIKKFGIAIAKAKMEKMGISWSSSGSFNPSSQTTTPSSQK